MNVIYDKETNRVLVTEIDGIWTFPSSWEHRAILLGGQELIEQNGEIYIKPATQN